MSTKNFLFFVLRLALLSLVLMFTALALTILAGVPTATAQGCTTGQTRTIWVDPHCCTGYPPVIDRTAQDQVCCAGTWYNDGAPYCKAAPFCAL
jgi:hypothetical protein